MSAQSPVDPDVRYIYALLDIDGTPRYVGQTKNVHVRLRNHWGSRHHAAERPTRRLGAWLASLEQKPAISVLEIVDCDRGFEAEAAWTVRFREQGHDLFNVSTGASISPGSAVKIADALRGRSRPSEIMAKVAAANRGRKQSPETRAKIGDGNRGKTVSPEARAKISAAQKGKTLTPEHRAKITATSRSPETRAKMSAAARRREATKRAEREAAIALTNEPVRPSPSPPKDHP